MKHFRGIPVVAGGALLLGLFSGGCDGGGGLNYVHGWKTALETARSDAKPILLNFGGSW